MKEPDILEKSGIGEINMKNIYILWASIRPEFVLSTSNMWIDNCKNKDNLFFKIVMASDEQKAEVESFNIPNCEVTAVTNRRGYNYAITQLTLNLELNNDDILIFLTDDFTCQPNWDEYIYQKFENYNNALFLNDGRQDPNKKDNECITLGCLTFECLKKLNNVLFSPNYYHFYSDNEAFHNLNALGLLKDDRAIDCVVFKHEHHSFGHRNRDEFDATACDHWSVDQNTYNIREKMSVQERLATIVGE